MITRSDILIRYKSDYYSGGHMRAVISLSAERLKEEKYRVFSNYEETITQKPDDYQSRDLPPTESLTEFRGRIDKEIDKLVDGINALVPEPEFEPESEPEPKKESWWSWLFGRV